MTTLRFALRQVRFVNKAFWRNPASAFFTFAFPLLFLVIFTSLLGNDTSTLPSGREVANSTYFTVSILAFGVISASYMNLAMSVTFLRDDGVLKRVRGAPVPSAAYLLGRVIHAVLIMLLLVVIMCIFGAAAYDVSLPVSSAPAFVVTLALGAFTFCSLGLLCTAAVPNADAAPAIVNATMMPVLFLSGVFIPIDDGPSWIRAAARVLPVRPFLTSLTESFIPSSGHASGWRGGDLLTLAVWGVAGLALAARWFRWEPRR
jgi:ABC-2 type transport system permease protein